MCRAPTAGIGWHSQGVDADQERWNPFPGPCMHLLVTERLFACALKRHDLSYVQS